MNKETIKSWFLCSDSFCMTLKNENTEKCIQCNRITPFGIKMMELEEEEEENGERH